MRNHALAAMGLAAALGAGSGALAQVTLDFPP